MSLFLLTGVALNIVIHRGAIPVIIATRSHLFPFRTQKLSSSTAKVVDPPRSARIASCRISKKRNRNHKLRLRLFLQLAIRHGRTNEAFHRTVDTHCPCRSEMSERIAKGASGDRGGMTSIMPPRERAFLQTADTRYFALRGEPTTKYSGWRCPSRHAFTLMAARKQVAGFQSKMTVFKPKTVIFLSFRHFFDD